MAADDYKESMVSDIGRASLREIGYKCRWCAGFNHPCEKFGLMEPLYLLWLRNFSNEGMTLLKMEHDRNE